MYEKLCLHRVVYKIRVHWEELLHYKVLFIFPMEGTLICYHLPMLPIKVSVKIIQ